MGMSMPVHYDQGYDFYGGQHSKPKEEHRIEKLGALKKTQRRVNVLRQIARIFMRNILSEEQLKKTKKTREAEGVVKYQYIYKNMLREVKIFFKKLFVDFCTEWKHDYIKRTNIKYNYSLDETMFLVQLFQFVIRTFDIKEIGQYFDNAINGLHTEGSLIRQIFEQDTEMVDAINYYNNYIKKATSPEDKQLR